MKQGLLDRYERDAQGRVLIDVAAARIEDLYSNFDRSAPYIRRDLEAELAAYLIDCARELGAVPLVIRFTFDSPPDAAGFARIRRSLNTYFHYLADSEVRHILQLLRRASLLFAIGLCILALAVWLNLELGEPRSIIADVFAEGLTIAAWVSLWEALATLMIEWFPLRRNVLLYRRLAGAELGFRRTADLIPAPHPAAPAPE